MKDITEIQHYLPHRYPFLLVDRILEVEEGKRAVGLKNVTMNEPFFQGHFPEQPIMPGVLILEALAQVGGYLALSYLEKEGQRSAYFMGIDKAKFRKPVVPGDSLRLEVGVLKQRGKIWVFKGAAYVEDTLVSEAELMAMMVSEDNE